MTQKEQVLAKFKATAQANQMIPRALPLSMIKIIDSSTIEIQGHFITLEKKAFRDIIAILGMNEKVLKVFDSNFGSEKTQVMINLIQGNLSSSGLQVVLYANPKARSVERIVPSNKQLKGLSIETYFNTLERMFDENPDFVIKRTIADPLQVQIDLVDPKAEFRIANKNIETFHPGVSFGTAFNQPTFVQNFTERLVCTNGMVHRDSLTSYSLNENFSKEHWVKFFEHMEAIKKNGWVSPKFNEKVQSAMECPASLSEMYQAFSMLRSVAGNDANLWIPMTETENRFKGIDVNPELLNPEQMKTAKTGTSVWDLVNNVTDFASHNLNYKVTEMQRLNMQVQAGRLLMKDSYDMQNIMTKSPF